MKVKIIAFILILLMSVSCTESKKERSKKQVNIAIRLNYENQQKKALEHLNKAIELDENNIEAYFYKAVVYNQLNKYQKAIEILDTTIIMKPDYGEAYKQRALAKFYLHDKLGSCEDWIKADSLGVPNLENKVRHCK